MAWPATSARSKNWGTEILTDTDLEAELDLLHDYFNDALNSSTGHKHDGTTSEGPKILTANINDSAGTAGDFFQSNGSAITRTAIGTANQVVAVNSGATALEFQTVSADQSIDGSTVQVVNTNTGAVATGTTAIPDDDTIPQITEGDQFMSLAITPGATTNKLKIEVVAYLSHNSGTTGLITGALFQDSTAGALAAGQTTSSGAADGRRCIHFVHYMSAGTTSATTFKFRAGGSSGTTTLNGVGGSRKFGGVLSSSITITEIKGS